MLQVDVFIDQAIAQAKVVVQRPAQLGLGAFPGQGAGEDEGDETQPVDGAPATPAPWIERTSDANHAPETSSGMPTDAFCPDLLEVLAIGSVRGQIVKIEMTTTLPRPRLWPSAETSW